MEINLRKSELLKLEHCIRRQCLNPINEGIYGYSKYRLPEDLFLVDNGIAIEVKIDTYIQMIKLMYEDDVSFIETWKTLPSHRKPVLLVTLFGLAGCVALLRTLTDFITGKKCTIDFPLRKLVALDCILKRTNEDGLTEFYECDIINALIETINSIITNCDPETIRTANGLITLSRFL